MGSLTQEEFDRFRDEGRSEQEIAYFDAVSQKDYDPILKDPNTPTKVITDIVDRITLVPLKILALKHPNISSRSQKYILEKADKTKSQKDIIKAFLTSPNPLLAYDWRDIRKYYNTAQRLDLISVELIMEQADISTYNLDVILNTLSTCGTKETYLDKYIEYILEHKNFDIEILKGDFFIQRIKPRLNLRSDIVDILRASSRKEEIFMEFYNLTEDTVWLPDELNAIFFNN